MVKSTVTPGGSQWGDGSNAGRSIISASKSGAAGGKSPQVTGGASSKLGSTFNLMPESLGNDKWNEALAPLREVRNKLDEKIKSNKKKRKKRNKKSNLKGSQWTQSEGGDDMVSAYTGYTSNMDEGIDIKDKITEDFFGQQGKPRDFAKYTFVENQKFNQTITPVLTLLEIDDYDEIKTHDKLYVNVRKALIKFRIKWRTVDEERIKQIIRYCIIREINQIEGRKCAREYQARADEYTAYDDLLDN